MSADLQYTVAYKEIGPIFKTATYEKSDIVRFIRETEESKYTLRVNLSDFITGFLSEVDFESIESLRQFIERAERYEDSEELISLKEELSEQYDEEDLADYDKYEGDYSEYILAVANKVLEDMISYDRDLEDYEVFVETWL